MLLPSPARGQSPSLDAQHALAPVRTSRRLSAAASPAPRRLEAATEVEWAAAPARAEAPEEADEPARDEEAAQAAAAAAAPAAAED